MRCMWIVTKQAAFLFIARTGRKPHATLSLSTSSVCANRNGGREVISPSLSAIAGLRSALEMPDLAATIFQLVRKNN